MELSVWKCTPGKLYYLQLKDGRRFIAKHLICLEFYILFKVGCPKHIRYTHHYEDIVQPYPSAKERVQDKMEERALHLILRRELGDPNFTW